MQCKGALLCVFKIIAKMFKKVFKMFINTLSVNIPLTMNNYTNWQ